MKYSISINQAVLAKTKLDLKDCAILDYLKDFCSVEDRKIKRLTFTEKNREYRYTWINFNHLIKEMPLLRLKGKASISERMANLSKEGFIKTFLAPDNTLYVRTTERILDLDFERTEQDVLNHEQTTFDQPNSTNILSTNHNISNTIAAKPQGFDNEAYIRSMETNKQPFIQIIGSYAKIKEIQFENAEHAKTFIKRNLRIAGVLKALDFKKVKWWIGFLHISNIYPDFTLETVEKCYEKNPVALLEAHFRDSSEQDDILQKLLDVGMMKEETSSSGVETNITYKPKYD